MARSDLPIIIIGAGIAGLSAAQLLNQAGLPVLVLDKGRGVGGRMATRRFGGGRFDHGAQFFTVRHGRFQEQVSQWQAAEIIAEWGHGFASDSGLLPSSDYPRYRGNNGMTAVPKYLAHDLDIRLQTRVTAVSDQEGQWIIETESGQKIAGQALLLTPPVPQSLALLEVGKVSLPDDLQTKLAAFDYHSCLALMALFAGPSKLPAPGGLQFSKGPIAWIADNQQKGISPDGFGVTIHATPAYSQQHWQTNSEVIAQGLLDFATNWLHDDLLDWQLHRWRYSQPTTTYTEPAVILPGPPMLAFAGDAFGGPRVEGAAISGLAAAESLLLRMNPERSHETIIGVKNE